MVEKSRETGPKPLQTEPEKYRKKNKSENEEHSLRRGGRTSRSKVVGIGKKVYLGNRATIVGCKRGRRSFALSCDVKFSLRTLVLRMYHLILFITSMLGRHPRHLRNRPPSSCSSSRSLSWVGHRVVPTFLFELVLSRHLPFSRRPLRPPICHGHCGPFPELVAGLSWSWL